MFKHPIDILHYVRVRDTHNPKAFAREPIRTAPVIVELRCMCFAIDFNDQSGLGAEEVGDGSPDPNLAAEFEAVHLPCPQALPEPGLCCCCFLPGGADAAQAIE
jgi:hypothetical protein